MGIPQLENPSDIFLGLAALFVNIFLDGSSSGETLLDLPAVAAKA